MFRTILPTASLNNNSLSLILTTPKTSSIHFSETTPPPPAKPGHNHSRTTCTVLQQLPEFLHFLLPNASPVSSKHPNAFSKPYPQSHHSAYVAHQRSHSLLSKSPHYSFVSLYQSVLSTLVRKTAEVQGMPPCCAPVRQTAL